MVQLMTNLTLHYKTASLHFPCTDIYKKRVLRLRGKMCNYGALAVEECKK